MGRNTRVMMVPIARPDMMLTAIEPYIGSPIRGAMPRMVVSDGKIDENELKAAGVDKNELTAALNAENFSLRDVFYCFCLGGGEFEIVGRDAK